MDSENFTFLFWDAVLISSPILRPSVAPTLRMGVKRGNSKSHTEPPVWSCILLPLQEMICNQEPGLCKAHNTLEHDPTSSLCPRVGITGCLGTGSCHWSSPHLERHFPLSHCDIPWSVITQTYAQSVRQAVTCSCQSKHAANTISMAWWQCLRWQRGLCQSSRIDPDVWGLCRWKRQDLQSQSKPEENELRNYSGTVQSPACGMKADLSLMNLRNDSVIVHPVQWDPCN